MSPAITCLDDYNNLNCKMVVHWFKGHRYHQDHVHDRRLTVDALNQLVDLLSMDLNLQKTYEGYVRFTTEKHEQEIKYCIEIFLYEQNKNQPGHYKREIDKGLYELLSGYEGLK